MRCSGRKLEGVRRCVDGWVAVHGESETGRRRIGTDHEIHWRGGGRNDNALSAVGKIGLDHKLSCVVEVDSAQPVGLDCLSSDNLALGQDRLSGGEEAGFSAESCFESDLPIIVEKRIARPGDGDPANGLPALNHRAGRRENAELILSDQPVYSSEKDGAQVVDRRDAANAG